MNDDTSVEEILPPPPPPKPPDDKKLSSTPPFPMESVVLVGTPGVPSTSNPERLSADESTINLEEIDDDEISIADNLVDNKAEAMESVNDHGAISQSVINTRSWFTGAWPSFN